MQFFRRCCVSSHLSHRALLPTFPAFLMTSCGCYFMFGSSFLLSGRSAHHSHPDLLSGPASIIVAPFGVLFSHLPPPPLPTLLGVGFYFQGIPALPPLTCGTLRFPSPSCPANLAQGFQPRSLPPFLLAFLILSPSCLLARFELPVRPFPPSLL